MARRALVLFGLLAALGWARNAERDYALILEEPAAAVKPQALTHIRTAQNGLRAQLAQRNVPVTGAVQTLLNAVFVSATEEEAARLRALPGVKRVVWVRPVRHHLDRAVDLVNANGGLERRGRAGKRRRGRQNRHHRYRHRPHPRRLQRPRAHRARGLPQGQRRLHQRQNHRGPQLRGPASQSGRYLAARPQRRGHGGGDDRGRRAQRRPRRHHHRHRPQGLAGQLQDFRLHRDQ